MRLILAITTYNEVEYGPHIEMQLNDALTIDFDEIVILDDGSNDGTWEILKEYDSKHKHIHIFRNDDNSVRSRGANRWLVLADKCSEYSPDWICIRAADMLYTAPLKRDLRQIITRYSNMGYDKLRFPLIHLWRSDWWYRADSGWGRGSVALMWRFHENFSWIKERNKAIDHQGAHIPDLINGRKLKMVDVKERQGPSYKYAVLHYGHTTHEKKEIKFIDMMERAEQGRTIQMPPAKDMPPASKWINYNGYKGFWEYNIQLAKVPQLWFDEPVPDVPRPEIKSFYELIKKYNKKVAEEYKIRFDKRFKRK